MNILNKLTNAIKAVDNKFTAMCDKVDQKCGGDAEAWMESKLDKGCDIIYDSTGKAIAYSKAKLNCWLPTKETHGK